MIREELITRLIVAIIVSVVVLIAGLGIYYGVTSTNTTSAEAEVQI